MLPGLRLRICCGDRNPRERGESEPGLGRLGARIPGPAAFPKRMHGSGQHPSECIPLQAQSCWAWLAAVLAKGTSGQLENNPGGMMGRSRAGIGRAASGQRTLALAR